MKTQITYTARFAFLCLALCMNLIVHAQPVANFTAAPVSGCAPLIVQFNDNSSGSPASWNWNLGNGTTSSQKNPVTTYSTPGVYTVTLTVSNNAGNSSVTKTSLITVYDKPQVRFTTSDSADCIPFTTSFRDLSSTLGGNITSWHWDFDDGSTSTLQNPQHLYNQPGNFNITLQVTNSGGCSASLSKLSYIKAADSIRTQFNFSKPVKCKPPETILFTNNTVGPSTMSYKWDFGDGTSSTTFSPSHTYTNGGTFTLQLMVSNTLGCRDTLILRDTLKIKNVHSAITSDDTVCVNYRTPLVNSTSPAPLSSKWIFGDGTSSFGLSTAKAWASPGNYTVKLVSNFNACSDSVTKIIKVLAAPVINFTASDTVACRAPLTVNFTDATAGAVSWLWNFSDGGSTTLQNPSHTFNSEGEFHVKLTVSSAAGCSTSSTSFRYIRVSKPQISIDVKEGGGCIPYSFQPYPTITAPDGIASYLWDFGNGHTSANRFPTEIYTDSGTYNIKLTVTSVDGCTDSLEIPAGVRTGNKPYINFGISPTVVCPGVDVQFTDSSAPADKWLWKFGDKGASEAKDPKYQFSDSGKMAIKLIAWNNGCKDSVTKYRAVTVLPGLARFRPVYNCNNKKEVFFKDSSILPETWLWDFGDGTSATNASPTHVFNSYQTYNVTLTTTSGACTNKTTVPVKLVEEIPGFTVSNNNICKSDSVYFYMQGFNKKNIAKFIWNFGDGTTDSVSADSVKHIYANAGIYSVSLIATDSNGCSETSLQQNLVKVNSPKAGFRISGTGGCQNKPVSFIDTSNFQSGNFNISSWVLDFGDGQVQRYGAPLPNPVTHTYSSTGFYYPSLKITDSAGCSDSIFYSLPVGIYQPTANFFSPNFNTCINDTVILRNPSTGNRLQYLWTFGDGSSSTDSLPLKKYFTNGDFTIKLVVTDAAGCKDSLTKINYVKVRDVTASFTTSDSVGICTPFQIHLTNTSSNAFSQVWDFGDGGFSTTANPTYTYTVPGTYFIKLSSKRTGHCVKTDSAKIIIKAPSATLAYAPVTGCAPLTVRFTVSTTDSAKFIWDFNDGSTYTTGNAYTNYAYTAPGSFVPSVVVKDTNGCILPLVGKDTIRLYSSKVNFSAVNSAICLGDTVRFSDSSYSGSQVTGYHWEFGDGAFSSQQDPAHYYTNPGTYTVKEIIYSSFGCTDSLVKNNIVKVYAKPEISIAGYNPTYCGTTSIGFTGINAVTDTAATAWLWNFGNGNTSSLQNPLPQLFTDTGSFNIQLSVNYSTGCSDTSIAAIHIYPLPTTNAGNDTAICQGNSMQLHATGADHFNWQPAGDLSCTNCANPFSNTSSAVYYYVTGTNNFGCTKTDSIYIDVKKPFRLYPANSSLSVCAGKSVQLSVSGAEEYTWLPVAGLNNSGISDPVATPTANTTYTVTGFDSMHCFSDTAFITVEVLPAPSVNAGNDIVLLTGREITLTPSYSPDIVNWQWSPSTGLNCTNCANPVANPGNGIMYTIQVTNNFGCLASDDIFVQLKCDKSNIYLPGAFSPAGVNKIFCPLTPAGTPPFTVTSFTVYNRFGQPVFQSGNFLTNDKSRGWDGKFNGAECPAGAYVYTIEFICSNRQPVVFNGNILLLR